LLAAAHTVTGGKALCLEVRSFVVQLFVGDVRRLLVLVLVAMGVLAAATTLLARFYHGEQVARAARHLEAGRELMAAGATAEAVSEFRASLGLARDDPEAARLLAQALLQLGRIDEAQSYLSDLLRRYPVDGRMNRDMARVAAARGRGADAQDFYRRAIYGVWNGEPIGRRIDTRFELAEYLHATREEGELVAELLLLKGEVPAEDIAAHRRIASLLVEVNVVDQAIEVLQAAATVAPRDVALLAQLADVQAEAGQMAEARTTLRSALAVDPATPGARDQIAFINRVLALDPTLPRLRLPDRTQRAGAILTAVVQHLAACDATDEERDRSIRAMAAPYLRRGVRDAEAAEQALRLASDLWEADPGCHDGTPEARAIERVLRVVRDAQDPVP
jgi:tetratricopeptide (TPR) repeat protein